MFINYKLIEKLKFCCMGVWEKIIIEDFGDLARFEPKLNKLSLTCSKMHPHWNSASLEEAFWSRLSMSE